MPTKDHKYYLILILLLAFLLRAGYVLYYPSYPDTIDAAEYDAIAMNLANGSGFSYLPSLPTSYRPPTYVFFLASIYSIFGYNWWAARVIEIIMSSILIILVYRIAKIFFSNHEALTAAFLAAIHVPLIIYCANFMSEGLMAFLLAILILLILKQTQEPKRWSLSLWIGCTLGLAALTKASLVPLVILIPIWLLWFLKPKKNFWFKALIMFFVGTGIIFLWGLRNLHTQGHFILVDSHGGFTFWQNHNLLSEDGYFWSATAGEVQDRLDAQQKLEKQRIRAGELPAIVMLPHFLEPGQGNFDYWGKHLKDQFKGLSEPEVDAKFWQLGFEAVQKKPLRYFKQVTRESIKFWHIFNEDGRYLFSYGCILPFFLLGFLVNIKRRDLSILYLPILAVFAVCITINNNTRFRLPVEPFFLILASSGIFWLIRKFEKRLVFLIILLIILLNILLWFYQVPLREMIRNLISNFGFMVFQR